MTEKEIIWHDIKCLRVATKIMCFGGRKEDVFKMLGYLKNPLAWKKVCDTIELRYNDGSHYTKDEHGRFTGSTSSGGGSSSSGGGRVSGGISGALDPYSDKAQEHAERYYQSVRKMTNDYKKIAKNTGFEESEIKQIKDFIFMQKHDLGNGYLEYFYPSYEMAQ